MVGTFAALVSQKELFFALLFAPETQQVSKCHPKPWYHDSGLFFFPLLFLFLILSLCDWPQFTPHLICERHSQRFMEALLDVVFRRNMLNQPGDVC
jgi:hypothetical protein